ncbi:MAG TPA: DPP IV N-terminal domain-containing protein [Gemmatimonadales bacterium]|nr:DPP IV N-terminal domain-containing protein [Gemmatimonadales bacterium]
MYPPRAVNLFCLAILCVLVSCGDETSIGVPGDLSIQKSPTNSGDNQTDTVFATLAPLRVLVTRGSVPAAGVSVSWSFSPSDSGTAPGQSTTDASGIAALAVRYAYVGTHTIQASVSDAVGSPVSFTIAVTPGRPILRIVSGNNQSDTANARLAADYVVQVSDNHANALSGIIVDWAVTAGGGSITPTRSTTDQSGYATARYTLGADTGSQTVTATASALPDVPRTTFTASAFRFSARALAFADDSGGIYTINSNGTGFTPLNLSGRLFQPTWSPDGSKIASRGDSSDAGVHVMNADGTHLVRLTTQVDGSPAWSPDGSRITFVRSGQIQIMNADGTNVVQLTNDTAAASDPAWSPNGTVIAFARSGNIYVMNADGTNPLAITTWDPLCGSCGTPADGQPAWSPDGSRIVFRRVHPACQLCSGYYSDLLIVNADGSGETTLFSGNARCYGGGIYYNCPTFSYSPAWSPDDLWIAFASSNDCADWGDECALDVHLQVISVDGRRTAQVYSGTADAPSWRP